jgi:hypothetical protein
MTFVANSCGKFLAVSGLLALTACAKQVPPEEPRTVSWYLAHKDERTAKQTWCADDAARQATANCINAHEAWHQANLQPNAKSFADGVKFK